MKTIKQVLTEFLKDQKSRLKPRTYRGYEDAIDFFQDYLDGYAYQYLHDDDTALFDRLYGEEDKEFCEIFSPDKISSYEISEFLSDFMIRKVIGSRELMKKVGVVMARLVEWMKERGIMDEEEYEDSAARVDDLKDKLPEAEELSRLMYDYIQDNPYGAVDKTVDSYFRIAEIEPGRLWLHDIVGSSEKIGPVFVSTYISSKCKMGQMLSLNLGRTKKGWEILEVGFVFPR